MTWSTYGDLTFQRYDHHCGKFKSQATNETFVIVAGGQTYEFLHKTNNLPIEILNVDSNQWTFGKLSITYNIKSFF